MSKKPRPGRGAPNRDRPRAPREEQPARNERAPRGDARRPSRRPSRRALLIAGGAVLALIVAALSFSRGRSLSSLTRSAPDSTPFPPPLATAAPVGADITPADFVGAERCASCHRTEYDAWSRSTHGRAGGVPGNVPVLGPFDGTPIRFRDATVIPAMRGGRFTFTVRREHEADQLLTVDGVIGGGHMEGGGTQGFVTKWTDGTWRFLPFDYSRHGKVWFCNTGSRTNKGWIPISSDMSIADCGDWPPLRVLGDAPRFTNCQSCHGSQIDLRFDTTAKKWSTRFTSLAINCESCHGPGRRHIQLVSSGEGARTGDIGMAALATYSKDRSLGVCFQCHAVKDELSTGYLPGKSLEQHYSLRLAQLGDAPYQPDGRVRTFAYQQGHLYSDCYLNGGMTCTSCHDPHSQGYRDANGRALVGRFDDGQCTSCHVSKADPASVAQHTKHRAGTPAAQCTSCHMPYLQEPELGPAIRYARSDHVIPIPRPAFDSAMGVISACRQCHQQKSEQALDADLRRLWGDIKPHAPIVDALVKARSTSDRDEAARLALDPESSFRAAVFQGESWFLENHLTADMPELGGDIVDRLERLARSDDIDIRAIALASLHYARGTDRRVRDFLRERLAALGPDDALVRARWAIVLGYLGDRSRAKGDAALAVTAYEKALEVQPQSARVLLNLGLAYADAGDAARAIDSYRRSLALDARQPLALVNMGIALQAQNSLQPAIDAYRQAIALNPYEALAYFNLGNAYLSHAAPADAIPFYEKATQLDPSIALAHLYLARSYGATGRYADALASARRALLYASDNDEAREMVRQLEAAGVK
jgi:tetratricopeptide (TPR) repeat protein